MGPIDGTVGGTLTLAAPDAIEYIDYSKVGAWTPEFESTVERERAIAFAAAVNDVNARYRSENVAHPLFAVVANREAAICGRALALSRGNPPPFQRVHGEHDIFFDQPLRHGMRVWSRAALVGVRVKRSGTALTFQEDTRDESGASVNRQYRLVFLPGVAAPHDAGIDAPRFRLPDDHRPAGPRHTVSYRIDADQTFRYAAASGDWSRYHIDDAFARSVGAPGIVLHGLCTMALMARAVVDTCCDGKPADLKRLALRFVRPVLPGQSLEITIWGVATQPGTYGFEATSSSGETVVRYGRADVISSR